MLEPEKVIQALNLAAALAEAGVRYEHMDLDTVGSMRLTVWGQYLTPEALRAAKRLVGPLRLARGYLAGTLYGHASVGDVSVEIASVGICEVRYETRRRLAPAVQAQPEREIEEVIPVYDCDERIKEATRDAR